MKKTVVMITVACLFAVTVWFSGCATILKGTNEIIRFKSTPPGAAVKFGSAFMGTTPLDVKVESNVLYSVQYTKNGYEPRTFITPVKYEWGYFFLNLITSVGLGSIIDDATGASYTHTEKEWNIPLEEKK